jgi:hypothetical protein
MSNFYVRGILANLVTLAVLLACLFVPAGTLNYWQAWVFVAVFQGPARRWASIFASAGNLRCGAYDDTAW